MVEIFISHSQKDKDVLRIFNELFAGTTIRAVRAEFEKYALPPWNAIKNWVANSSAVFLLLGPNLEGSLHTSNWVSWEVGLASALNKDVWVYEQVDTPINFPVPYLNHYMIYDPSQQSDIDYIKKVIDSYDQSPALAAGVLLGLLGFAGAGPPGAVAAGALGLIAGLKTRRGIKVTCPYDGCGVMFGLHSDVQTFKCPSCRQTIRVG